MSATGLLPVSPDHAAGALVWLVEATTKGTLVLLAAVGLALALRRGSAASRHLVWACCLAMLLTLPAITELVPAWTPGLLQAHLPDDWAAAMDRDFRPVTRLLGVAGRLGGSTAIDGPEANVVELATIEIQGRIAADTVNEEKSVLRRLSLAGWALALWAAGAVVVLAWLAAGLYSRRKLRLGARVLAEGPWVEAVASMAAELGLRRCPVVLRGDDDIVPMTWGTLRPVLLLPPAADLWAPEEKRSVLLHELAHIRRWDSLSRTVSQLACALFWFHPLVWYAAHRLLREQERACDDVVLLAGAAPDRYAATLLSIAREMRTRRPAVVGALALARRTNLETRLLSILDPRRKRSVMSASSRITLFIALLVTTVSLAALRPAPAEEVQIDGGSMVLTSTASMTTAEHQEKPRAVAVTVKGEVGLAAELDDIEVGPGGRFVIQELGDEVEPMREAWTDEEDPRWGRRLEIVADASGDKTISWRIDGEEMPLDEEARAWLQPTLDRLTDSKLDFLSTDEDVFHRLILAGDELGTAVIARGEGEGRSFAIYTDKAVVEAHADAAAEARGYVILPREGELRVLTEEGGEVVKAPHVILRKGVGEEGEMVTWEVLVGEEGETRTLTLVTPKIEAVQEGEAVHVFVSPHIKLRTKGEGEEGAVVVVPEVEVGTDVEVDTGVVVARPHVFIKIEGLEKLEEVVELAEGEELPEFVKLHIVDKIEPRVVIVGHDDQERHRRSIRIRSRTDEDKRLDITTHGEVEIGDTIEELEIGEDGELLIDELDQDGVVRQLSVRLGPDGELLFEYHVDGEERPFDDAARAWLERILERIKS